MAGETSGENSIEIFQILTKLLRFQVFAHLHLINIHDEPMTLLVLMSNLKKNVLKALI